ncbi:MAG: sigma-54-dependent Fis family transcriptional regulator [Planctomycetes bacterium]|nr:sigma-54-dependent Fis family transcriptional regulator [Planctomycetota bacterium]
MNQKAKVLIIDEDKKSATDIEEFLSGAGFDVAIAASAAATRELMESSDFFDVVIADEHVKDADAIEILGLVKQKDTLCQVIIASGKPSIESAVNFIKAGAEDYLSKPVNTERLRDAVEKALVKRSAFRQNLAMEKRVETQFGFERIIGRTVQMQKIIQILKQIAGTDVTVLVQGESGTGKELIAKAIHLNSTRRNKQFVPLNCAALSEGILESELFGHEKGAFTGAAYQRKGRFEFADGGTLFLDEIGDMPMSTQIKLLRVIETSEVFRVGNNVPLKVDVRLIAATNRDLEQLVREKVFRNDLFFRLKVFTINLSPLRERLADLPFLVDSFVKEFAAKHNRKITGITQQALKQLSKYSWPGNVRELRNCVESMIVISTAGKIDISSIPEYIVQKKQESVVTSLSGVSMNTMERELIKNTLATAGNNRAEAAKILGIGERTLYRKIKEYGLE